MSHLLFSYATSLTQLGLSKHLEVDDVWDVPAHLDVTTVSTLFQDSLKATISNKSPKVGMQLVREPLFGWLVM